MASQGTARWRCRGGLGCGGYKGGVCYDEGNDECQVAGRGGMLGVLQGG